MKNPSGVPNPVVVRFLNPTTNKALHLGHIRGACLGSALASCFSYLGSLVATHCILEDVGPHMALAIHGLDRLSARGIKPEIAFPKSDHEAHSYYIHGGRLCTSTAQPGRTGRRGRTVQLWNARVPDRLMTDWAKGSPHIIRLARHIRDLALEGQSETLEQLGVGFSFRDFESGENPYICQFIEDGIEQGIFRRLRNGGVVWKTEAGFFPLRCANVHFEESAYLLSFLYRCMAWYRPEWSHVAFAGKEWARVFKHFPSVLESLGVKHVRKRYRVVFYGMVTVGGRKLSSSFGRGLLADEVFNVIKSLPRVRRLVQRANGIVSATEIARMLIRLSFLKVSRTKDVELSLKAICDPSGKDWRIVETVADVCGEANRHWTKLGRRPKGHPDKSRMELLARAAVRDCTFDPIIAELALACELLRSPTISRSVRRGARYEMANCLQLIGSTPLDGTVPLNEAPSFLSVAQAE